MSGFLVKGTFDQCLFVIAFTHDFCIFRRTMLYSPPFSEDKYKPWYVTSIR